MPKISVIIPCFNAERFLKECLESLLNQSFKDIEVITINDGSSDDTLKILNKFASIDNRLVIIDQKNSGASAARNAGIKLAKGEYLAFLDSDDFAAKDSLSKFYEAAKKYDADTVFGDFNTYKDGYTTKVNNYICEGGLLDKESFLFDYFTIDKAKSIFPTMCAKLIKTSLIKENNLLFLEDIFIAEDSNLSAKILWLSQKIVKINESVYSYRVGLNNSSKSMKFKNFEDVRKCELDLREFFAKFEKTKKQEEYLECYFLHLHYDAALSIEPYSFKEYQKALKFACADIKSAFKSKGFKYLSLKLKILYYLYRFFPNSYPKIIKLRYR